MFWILHLWCLMRSHIVHERRKYIEIVILGEILNIKKLYMLNHARTRLKFTTEYQINHHFHFFHCFQKVEITFKLEFPKIPALAG